MRTLMHFLPFVWLPLMSSAQGLVGHEPTTRTVLLEEFTAINCGNCPAAHALANAIVNNHPGAVTVVGVHGGVLANPSGGQPDFRTTEGAALWSQFNVNFQPQGMVNRQGLQSHSQWNSAVNSTLAQASPVNIGMATTFETATRLLTVDVELYYTADGTGGNDRISVLLTEDHIAGYQQDYVNGAQPNYDHRHVLRAYMTPLVGDEVNTTSMGASVLRNYAFTVPAEWNIDACAAVAFVGEESVGNSPGVIYQVASVAASGGMTAGLYGLSWEQMDRAYPVPADDLVNLPIERPDASVLVMVDIGGRELMRQPIPGGARWVSIDVTRLPNGVYHYGTPGGPMKSLVVIH